MASRQALRERARLLDELHGIVRSMKNLAFAQLQRVSRELPALQQAVDAVGQARAALAEVAPASAPAIPVQSWLVIGAERGFCGAFNAHLAAEVRALLQRRPDAECWIGGRRLLGLLGDAAARLRPLPGCSSLDEAADVLDAWWPVLAGAGADGRQVALLHHDAHGIVQVPWPPAPAPPAGPGGDAPLHQLPPRVLRVALDQQAGRLALRRALAASLQEENRWRLSQMQFAQEHLERLTQRLRRQDARQRQAEITNELQTLAGEPAR